MDNIYTEKESPNDSVLQEDLDYLANGDLPVSELKGANILVTGSTGLVGSHLVRTLAALNRVRDLKITVILLARSAEKAERIYGNLLSRDYIKVVLGDVTRPAAEYIKEDERIDYIIHAAGVATSKTLVEKPAEALWSSLAGTHNMLELAREKRVKGFIYISSMEIYGTFQKETEGIKETDLGYIDHLSVRSNYPESRRMCENMCVSYWSEYQVPVRIARFAQTFGPGILPGENRVFAQFARSAANNENIVLHTEGKSEVNFCYIRDVMAALLILLVKGKNGEAYNVADEDSHTTVADMAKLVCEKIARGNIKVVFDIPEENVFGYAADVTMKLSSEKLRSLGWKSEVGMEEAYRKLTTSIKETEAG